MLTAANICWTLAPAQDGEIYSIDDVATIAIIEAQSYRVVAQQALHLLHEVMLERDVLREQRWLDRRRQAEVAA